MMKKAVSYILLIAVVCAFTACGSSYAESREKKRLAEREAVAEQRAAALCEALERGVALDSIRTIAEKDPNIFFYVFNARQMVYWSSNRLVTDEVFLTSYDTWREMPFRNAKTMARWSKAGQFNVLTVVPISFTELEDYTEIYAVAAQTFSFRQLLEYDKEPYARSRLPFILCHVLFGLVILIGIIGLIRNRGIRNMRLSTRIMYIILTPVLAVFIYIFFMSIRYVHTTYEQHQRHDLQMRSEYIQSYLRSLYYSYPAFTQAQAQGLSSDLRDLGYDMNQDIHVYSLSGELIASSSPALFNSGILSRRMAPEALFSGDHAVVCYEQIANHPYLVSYIPFHNGFFVPIGYIAVPYFLSEQTRNAEVDALLARLLPPYIIVLLLALFFSFAAARSMTSPILMLTDKMRHFEIGAKNNHIDYPYHDELGELVERYNMLVDEVEESAEQLAKAEREGAWRTMARQIAHEINNPLTPMKLSVQKLQLKRGTDQFDAYFDKTTRMLISEIDNLAHIAQSFSTFAKQPEVVTTEVDVAEKLSHVITLQRANDQQIPIRYVGADSGVMGLADKEQISQVFVNILRNAIQALEGQKDADIIVVLNAVYSDKEMQISFSDNGAGIPADIQEKIFRPNFTTKSNGNGLGLAISKRIVEGSYGRLEFETSDKGTTFYVYLRKRT
ncbi:MAG: GHKL domain-containing protein [Paludibacteraceae bacterium]|nr:GHKL domain-containing protein [Paludibacteraceae bacterium]